MSTLPFDGAISAYAANEAPEAVRTALAGARNSDILAADYPYRKRMKSKAYEAELHALQIELVKFKYWVQASGARVVVLFEGRDAAGKGGAINRVTQHLNSRTARIEALPKPTPREKSQWFFQRYVDRLPAAGEIVLFDRSWYNRAVVEHVFGFCTADERERFFQQLPGFEQMLVEDGIHLTKIWLNLGRAEQLRRLLARESDPLRQWKLSPIDVQGVALWDSYTDAIAETFTRAHLPHAPWTVIRADDKRRARLAAIRSILAPQDYDGKDETVVGQPDPLICGTPAIWPRG